MDLEKIVVVVNNGMNTQENKYLIVGKGNGYIVSKSVKKVGSPKETGHQNKKVIPILEMFPIKLYLNINQE